MLTETFCDKYGIDANHLAVLRNQGSLPSSIFYKDKNDGSHKIDSSYILRRYKFKEMVAKANQDMYFYLSEHMNNTEIAQLYRANNVESMAIWFNRRLFALDECNITSYKISQYHWYFYRVSHYIRMRMNKVFKDTGVVDKILDRRTEW